MALSNETISQFAELTSQEKTEKKETTLKGTISFINPVDEISNQYFIKIDGSSETLILRNRDSNTTLTTGDRVNVTVKDHSAMITGSTTNPSVSKKTVISQINQSDEEIQIIADRINLEGVTTFVKPGDIYKNNTTTIDGGKIDTDSLFARNITATGNIQFENSNYGITADEETGDIIFDSKRGDMSISSWGDLTIKGEGTLKLINLVGYISIETPGYIIFNTSSQGKNGVLVYYNDGSGNPHSETVLHTGNIGDYTGTDYVIARGSNSTWSWRKWNSGTKECWLTSTCDSTTFQSWGNIHVSWNCIPSRVYPFTFDSTPTVLTSVQNYNVDYWLVTGNTNGTTSTSPSFSIARGTNYSGAIPYFSIYVIGK